MNNLYNYNYIINYCISFNRLLHWTEKTTENIVVLVEYDLNQMTSKVLYNDLRFPTLAENIEQSCIYIVALRPIFNIFPVQIQDSTSCPLGFTFPGNLQRQFNCVICVFSCVCVCVCVCLCVHTYIHVYFIYNNYIHIVHTFNYTYNYYVHVYNKLCILHYRNKHCKC